METVTCGTCGAEAPADAVYCPRCRRSVKAAVAPQAPQAAPEIDAEGEARLCPSPGCEQPLGRDDSVCGYCGEPVDSAERGPASRLAFPWGSHLLREGESLELGRAHPPFAAPLADYPNVGRTHARIARAGGPLLVTDLGSTNGTYVDGRRLPPHSPTELQAGQVLRLAASLEIEIQ